MIIVRKWLVEFTLDKGLAKKLIGPRFKHKLADCLMIMILAMMSNFNSQRSMEDFCRNHFEFFASVFGCGGVLPNNSLFNRVCIKLDFESLGKSLFTWVLELAKFFGLSEQLLNFQIDGKALRGALEADKVFDHILKPIPIYKEYRFIELQRLSNRLSV
jgi:DDE_Tnp_1-associated